MWKDYFYYTRSERRGIIVLLVIIVIGIVVSLFFPSVRSEKTKGDASFQQDYEAFIRSIEISDKKEYDKFVRPYLHREVVLAPFDPNTADSSTFVRLGLPPWMAGNIMKYRRKGGKFRKAEDFRKIYGLSEAQFETLRPYITLQEEKRDTVRMYVPRDTAAPRQFPIKYTAVVKMELNAVDTAELRKIPGVGSGIARMIVRYRQQLGGFYSIHQLDEIHLISANLSKWFTLNPALIRKMPINTAGLSRLNAHPYINFYQAKAIVEYRRKHGQLKSLKQLSLYEEFSESDLQRIGYYVTFD
jgi:DNA uptake protein ComE-like DNA-binding protein